MKYLLALFLTAGALTLFAEPSVVIRTGELYRNVLQKLSEYKPSDIEAFGNSLHVGYQQPELRMYPEIRGVCWLFFKDQKLGSCSGCAPDKFKCKSKD